MPADLQPETIRVPASVRFPIELEPPEGFRADDPATWPRVEGRLEWVEGRLLYMPPCGELQPFTVGDLTFTLGSWAQSHPGFVFGTNEAGMLLGSDVRGADAAVWRRADLGAIHAGVSRVPPLLAAEVAGRDEGKVSLRDKARWYLDKGVAVVWLLFPKEREVVVVTRAGESRHRMGERLPADPRLPDLAPRVDELFAQVAAA
jgi:Uma2 family endonuclease